MMPTGLRSMLTNLVDSEITLSFWENETRHEIHGRLSYSTHDCYCVRVGWIDIEFPFTAVMRVGLTGNKVWLREVE